MPRALALQLSRLISKWAELYYEHREFSKANINIPTTYRYFGDIILSGMLECSGDFLLLGSSIEQPGRSSKLQSHYLKGGVESDFFRIPGPNSKTKSRAERGRPRSVKD